MSSGGEVKALLVLRHEATNVLESAEICPYFHSHISHCIQLPVSRSRFDCLHSNNEDVAIIHNYYAD